MLLQHFRALSLISKTFQRKFVLIVTTPHLTSLTNSRLDYIMRLCSEICEQNAYIYLIKNYYFSSNTSLHHSYGTRIMRLVGAISSHQYKKTLSPILPPKNVRKPRFSDDVFRGYRNGTSG